MSRIHKEHLQAGYIFGDPHNSEYLYLPAGEVGSSDPRCIFEQGPTKEDLTLDEACRIIDRYTLKPCKHPKLGKRSFLRHHLPILVALYFDKFIHVYTMAILYVIHNRVPPIIK